MIPTALLAVLSRVCVFASECAFLATPMRFHLMISTKAELSARQMLPSDRDSSETLNLGEWRQEKRDGGELTNRCRAGPRLSCQTKVVGVSHPF